MRLGIFFALWERPQPHGPFEAARHKAAVQKGCAVPVTMPPTQTDWLRTVLFERGYLAKIKGEAIKVYLAMLDACGGQPGSSVTMSLRELMAKTHLSCPTVVDSLARLEVLGLVVSTTRQRGKVKTYYVSDPPAIETD